MEPSRAGLLTPPLSSSRVRIPARSERRRLSSQNMQGGDSDEDDGGEQEAAEEPCCAGVGLHFAFECLVKLVLEVLGAGGAVWGASDLTLLRNEKNQEIWRKVALATGAVFFLRWVWYIVEHLRHKRLYIYTHTRTTERIVFQKHTKTRKRALKKLRAAAHFRGFGSSSARARTPAAPQLASSGRLAHLQHNSTSPGSIYATPQNLP